MRDMSTASGWRNALLSTIILLAFFAPLLSFWIASSLVSPSRNYYTVDTEFPYFLNSLAVFKGGTYTYSDHPGTPLEEIGTTILAATYPALRSTPGGFISFHLRNPSVFLNAAHDFLVLGNLICIVAIFFAACRRREVLETLVAAAVATMYFAIHPGSLLASTVWNHNSFSFPFGTLLLIGLYRSVNRGDSRSSVPPQELALLGLAAGVLAAVQIYLVTWLLGMLLTVALFDRLQHRSWRGTSLDAAVLIGTGVAGFSLATLPIAPRILVFWNWIISIATHRSKYLAVPGDQETMTRLAANLGNFYEILPVLFVIAVAAVALACFVLLVNRRKLSKGPGSFSILAGLTMQLVTLGSVFLDHPLRDAYLLSIAAILPVWTLALMRIWDSPSRLGISLRIAFGVAVLVGTTLTSIKSMGTQRAEAAAYDATQVQAARSIAAYAQSIGRTPNDLVVLWMYGSYAPCWGLRTGDALAGNNFTAEIDAICGNQYRLGLNLRFDVHGDALPLEGEAWDMIFTCDRYLNRFEGYYPPGNVDRYPSIQWNCGSLNIIHRQ